MIQMPRIRKNFQFCFLRGCPSKFLLNDLLLSLKIAFILANSADPDEMPPYVALHQGFHCLLKYLFTGIQNEKGQ